MMSCDDFLKILVEQGGGRDDATKAAFEEHRRACEDCEKIVPAYGEYERAMSSPENPRENDPVKAKVMAYARDRIAREQLAEEIGKLTRRPGTSTVRRLAMAALVAAGFAIGLLVGQNMRTTELRPPPEPITLSPSRNHLDAAKALKALGDESWRKHAETVVADPGASPLEKEEARTLLRR